METNERGEDGRWTQWRNDGGGVYAVGDIITGAIQLDARRDRRGPLLSDRLFNGVPLEETCMDYDLVPTVVFSHPTMAVMGLTEAQAVAKYGADEVTCHKSTWVNMMYSREFLVDGARADAAEDAREDRVRRRGASASSACT